MPPRESKRILIVDDEPGSSAVLSEHFKAEHDVEVAVTGQAALRAVLEHRPDVVLLDIALSHADGVAVLRDIKAIDPTIPVIIVTASQDTARTAEALRMGAFGHVPKPFDFLHLDHMVGLVLDRS